MPTPREPRQVVTEPIVLETAETVVGPPMSPPVPPPVAPPPPPLDAYPAGGYPVAEQVVVEDVGGPHYVTTATGERVLVDDPGGTRVVTRELRPPLPPDEDPRRWNWLAPAMVFILLAALGIILAAVLLNNNNDKKNTRTAAAPPANTVTTTVQTRTPAQPANVSVQVPSVVGQSRENALQALDNAGLAVVIATVPGPAPAGQVLAQNPAAAGTLKSGDSVRINVSDGQATASNTTPQTSTPSSSTPSTSTPSTSTPASSAPSSSAPSSSTPSSGSSTPASTPEPTPVSVPQVSGDVKSAVQALVTKGLAATINYVPSDETMGTIVSQSPSAGTTSKTGTHITLSAASGPGDKELASVPDANGQTIKQAVGTMNAAGLRLILVKKTVADKSQAGKVVEQTPAPGAQAPKRAQVLVYMGAFKG